MQKVLFTKSFKIYFISKFIFKIFFLQKLNLKVHTKTEHAISARIAQRQNLNRILLCDLVKNDICYGWFIS